MASSHVIAEHLVRLISPQSLPCCKHPDKLFPHSYDDVPPRKPLNRRYIVVEGIYKATGELAPLDAICRLKHAHKFRLVVDESLAFGVLGKTGRGAYQHFGLQRSDVDIIFASMGTL